MKYGVRTKSYRKMEAILDSTRAPATAKTLTMLSNLFITMTVITLQAHLLSTSKL